MRTNALTELNTEVFTANGIEQQLKELKTYCLNRNIKVKRIFIENYVGKSTEQPELMKLIHFIESEESKIDSILFTTWDRISRNTSVLIDFQTECEKWNIIPCAIQ